MTYHGMLSRRALSDMTKNQAVGVTIGVVFAMILFLSIPCNLLVRRIKPKKYFLTSINPLVLVFTFPYHIYQLVRWMRHGKPDYLTEKDIESQSESDSSVSEHGRGMEDVSGWVFEQTRTYPSPHRITLPHHQQQQPLDLGLPNQIYLQTSKMTDPAGRQYIITEELPKEIDRRPSPESISLSQTPTAMEPGHPSINFAPSAHFDCTSRPYSIASEPSSRHSPYRTNGRDIIGSRHETELSSPSAPSHHGLSSSCDSSRSSRTGSEGVIEKHTERFVVGDDEDDEKDMEDVKI